MARLLLIGADEHLCDLLRDRLVECGHQVVVVADGQAGLTLLATTRIDLVIVDILMPGNIGADAIVQLRRAFPDCPIIAISNAARRGNVQPLRAAAELGAMRTLRKPFTVERLDKAIRQCLDQVAAGGSRAVANEGSRLARRRPGTPNGGRS